MEMHPDPFVLFLQWFSEAQAAKIPLPESMSLATATPDGSPSLRLVLFKSLSEGPHGQGFTFYTNYESRKARELDMNPRAALTFHWASQERQIRIEGTTEKVSAEESDAYWKTRPRGSQLGAIASRQSDEIEDRAQLEKRLKELEARFAGSEIPRPANWGGYRVVPERIEFWVGRTDRLHDRILYVRDGKTWKQRRLSP